jgi:hypothetical protein
MLPGMMKRTTTTRVDDVAVFCCAASMKIRRYHQYYRYITSRAQNVDSGLGLSLLNTISGSSFYVRVCPKSCKKVTSSLPVVQNLRYLSRATMTHLAVNILACQCPIYTKSPAMALPLPKEACPHQKRWLNWSD